MPLPSRVGGLLPALTTALLLVLPLSAHAVQEAEGVASHEIHLTDFFWPVVNFAVLCWVLYYFLKAPLVTYLRDRGSAIRKDLRDAASLKAAAAAQLEEIDRKLKALPGEIEALRRRGHEELVAEEQRIMRQAEAERDRLVEQARRDIDTRVRLARRELTEHAADLAVSLASERIARDLTADDHARLVDRFLRQVTG